MPHAKRTDDERWERFITGENPAWKWQRRILERLPGRHRCKNCSAPFTGASGVVMRAVGKGRYRRNPRFCNT
jgi:hypothetical protein